MGKAREHVPRGARPVTDAERQFLIDLWERRKRPEPGDWVDARPSELSAEGRVRRAPTLTELDSCTDP